LSWIQHRLDEEGREAQRKRALAASVFEKTRAILLSWSPAVEELLTDVGNQRWGKRRFLRRFLRRWTIERHLPSDAYPRWRLKKRGGREWYDLQLVCRKMPEAGWEGWREDQLTDMVASITDEDFFFMLDWGRDRRMAPLDAAELKEILWTAYHRGPTHEEI
jgi:hypothetical protein